MPQFPGSHSIMSEASPVMLYVPSQPVAKIEAKIAQVLLMIYLLNKIVAPKNRSMYALAAYYAQNYAGIIRQGLSWKTWAEISREGRRWALPPRIPFLPTASM